MADTVMLALPAPRIAGYLPPPRCMRVERPNVSRAHPGGLWLTTTRGTWAVLRPECLGELLRELR